MQRMPLSLRLILIVLAGAIVALSCFAVYRTMFPEQVASHSKLEGMENYVPAKEVKPAPAVHFLNEAGKDLDLQQFRGKVILLNLWATWCTPCVAEMPMLDRLQRRLGDTDAVVIALSIDRGGVQAVREFFDREGIRNLKVYVDPTMRAQSAMQAFGLPTTLIIDPDGNERGRLIGPAEWDDDAALDLITSAKAPKQP